MTYIIQQTFYELKTLLPTDVYDALLRIELDPQDEPLTHLFIMTTQLQDELRRRGDFQRAILVGNCISRNIKKLDAPFSVGITRKHQIEAETMPSKKPFMPSFFHQD